MSAVTLQWSVKDSLIAYMQSLEDGTVVAIEPAERTETGFLFVQDEQASNFDPETITGTLQFLGSAQFSGYGGMMNVIVKNPLIELSGDKGIVLTAQGGLLSPETFLPFATLEVTSASPLQASVYLTSEGRGILGEQYTAGQELSPLRIAAA